MTVEFDLGDLPDVDACERHRVAGHQPTRVLEVGGVLRSARKELQLIVLQGGDHDHARDGDTDDSHLYGITFALHGYGAHLPAV